MKPGTSKPAQYRGGALTIEPAETTAQMPEDVQLEEARADADREAPAIYGIDPANLGQVIAEAPLEICQLKLRNLL